jgi:hypothetical protein
MTTLAVRVLRFRAKDTGGTWSLSRWDRWAYTAKGLICLALGRVKGAYSCGEAGNWLSCIEPVTLATWDHPPSEPTIHSWSELAVGHGVLRNWHCHEFSNGS